MRVEFRKKPEGGTSMADRDELNTMRAIDMLRQSDEPLNAPRAFALTGLPSYLNALMGKRDMSTQQLFEQARLERSTGFKIMNGQRRPSRDVLLRVALVLKLDLEEAQQLLKVGRHAPLTPRDSRDQAVIRGLLHKKSLYDVDEILDRQGEEPL
jgi:hypothetical protein